METLPARLAAAFAIGLLVGLERGWRTRSGEEHRRAAGFRTFALSGLLGGIVGALAQVTGPLVLGFVFVGFALVFAAFHWMEAQADKNVSVTSVVAGMLTFVLGAYAVMADLLVAIACAVAATATLALREPLHRWIALLRWEELRAILILLAMTFLLLPVIPDRTIDPWNSLNPAEIWLLAILIATISFGGYIAIRAFGDRLGIVMAAIAGGLASSTATTLTLARLGREQPGSARFLAGGILLSGVVMLARVAVLASLLNSAVLPYLLAPLVAVGFVMLVAAALFLLGSHAEARPQILMASPLELAIALKLAVAIGLVMMASQWLQSMLGEVGLFGVAAASGIVDVDATTISMARLSGQQVELTVAVRAICIAVAVNTLAKAAIAGWVGGRKVGLPVGMASIAALLIGFLAY